MRCLFPLLPVFLRFDLLLSHHFLLDKCLLSIPASPSPGVSSLPLTCYSSVSFPALLLGFTHTFSHSLICTFPILLCSLSFPSHLVSIFSSFPPFSEGKWKVINYKIKPVEATHDLLSRWLSCNWCTKHDDERMKFLHYLIFINQCVATFLSFKILFYYKKRLSLLLPKYPPSCSVPFPFLASLFGEVIWMI